MRPCLPCGRTASWHASKRLTCAELPALHFARLQGHDGTAAALGLEAEGILEPVVDHALFIAQGIVAGITIDMLQIGHVRQISVAAGDDFAMLLERIAQAQAGPVSTSR